jgi:ketosteroid isomerase-like protein
VGDVAGERRIVRQALEKWNRGDPDAVSELMDDDVVLRMAEVGRSASSSGRPQPAPFLTAEFFWDHQEALEAAGLRE